MTKAELFRSSLYFLAVFLAASCGAIIVYDKSMDIINDEYTFSSAVYASSYDRLQLSVDFPVVGTLVKSPLKFYGTASGTWFFEASFPVKVTDQNGKVLGTGIAQATADWMTTSQVPFEGVVTFDAKGLEQGFLVFEEDDSSGVQRPRNFRLPVKFK